MIRTTRAALAVLAFAAIVAACSGGGASPSGVASLDQPEASPGASTTPTPSVDPQEALLAFAECMRENGIDMPDPEFVDGGGVAMGISGNVDREKMQAAQEACNHLMVGAFGPPKELSPEEKDALLAYSACMRENGIDMPDPVFADGGGVMIQRDEEGGSGRRIDPESEEFQAADEACRDLLGDLRGDGGPGIQVGPGGVSGSDSGSEAKP